MKYIKAIKFASLVGFGIIMTLFWLNELLDLPHLLLGAPPSPVNYKEAAVETLAVIAAASVFMLTALRLEKHIKYLEGLTVICSKCKKVRIQNQWIPVDQWLDSKTGVVFSHGVCYECLRDLYPEEYQHLVKTGKIVQN